MKSFGPLLRRLRGEQTRAHIARKMGITAGDLERLEAGRKTPPLPAACRLLCRGFGLTEEEAVRTYLELELFDYGLRDDELRGLAVDLIGDLVPPPVVVELRRLYRGYAGDASAAAQDRRA